jgi:hypothetical protein
VTEIAAGFESDKLGVGPTVGLVAGSGIDVVSTLVPWACGSRRRDRMIEEVEVIVISRIKFHKQKLAYWLSDNLRPHRSRSPNPPQETYREGQKCWCDAWVVFFLILLELVLGCVYIFSRSGRVAVLRLLSHFVEL